jgi:stage V sporulation protein B
MLDVLKKPVMGLTQRVLKRDFSGNTGKAVKNSIFSFSTTLISKVGSIIFTIILARLLLPELFGLYSLALSTILIFSAFSNLGVSQTLVKFISSSKSPKKSKAYLDYLLRIKLLLSLISISALFILAGPIAKSYYNKPIYFALLAGCLYIFIMGFMGFFDSLFHASNNFKKSFFKETLFQASRIILVSATILVFITKVSEDKLISFIILALSISLLFSFMFIFFSAKKEIKFLRLKRSNLTKEEKKTINKFILALSALTLSGVLFGFIDMFILGRYVGSEFIGFYRAAFSLITSATPLITFSGALFPIFSRLKGKRLETGLKKSILITLFLAVPAFLFTLVVAPFVVSLIFGADYAASSNILRIFSILIIILPLIAIYSSFLISQNKPRIVARSLFFASLINILLNYIFIFSLMPYGDLFAVYGATVATIISKGFYLLLLIYKN